MSLFSNEHMDTSGGIIQTQEYVQIFPTASATSQILFLCPALQSYKVLEVRAMFATASTSGTATIEYLTGTQVPGTGTAQTAVMSLSGTVNTSVVPAIPVATNKTLNGGDRLAINFAGTLTGLANCCIQLTLIRVK